MKPLVIDDFRGGLSKLAPEEIGANQASVLRNLIHVEGNLQTYDGNTKFTATEIGTNSPVRGGIFQVGSQGGTTELLSCGTNLYYWTNSAWYPVFSSMSDTLPAEFAQWNDYVYFTGALDICRWAGFAYMTGTVTGVGTTSLTGNSTAFVTASVRKGDTIWINTTGSTWVARTIYAINAESGAAALTLQSSPGTFTARPYIIVRIHTAGIAAPTDAWSLAAAAGSNLNIGTYKYAYTYYNSYVGVESPCYEVGSVVTTSGNTHVSIGATNTIATPTDDQIDQLKVYRTKVGGSVYYYHSTRNRDQAGFTFATSFTDSTADADLTTTITAPTADTNRSINVAALNTASHAKHLRVLNNRLYHWQTADYDSVGAAMQIQPNRVFFSNLNAAEYCPANAYGSTDILSIDQNVGGYIDVGYANVEVQDIKSAATVPEDTVGRLLILTSGPIHYWWKGFDWSDFELRAAFTGDCVSTNADTSDGAIFWVSRRGPMMLPPDANTPIPIYGALYPIYSNPFLAAVDHKHRRIVGICWQDWYIFAVPDDSSSINNHIYCYHIPTGTYTELYDATYPMNAGTFIICASSSDDSGLYYGDGAKGLLWKMFSKSTSNTRTYIDGDGGHGVTYAYKSGMFNVTDKDGNNYALAHAGPFRMLWRKPVVAHTPTVNVYANGNTSAAQSPTVAPALATGGDGRQWLECHPTVHGRQFEVEITGTTTGALTLEKYEWEQMSHGKSRGS